MFLIGVVGQIFEFQPDFQIARPAVPYSAIGFGAAVALGALYALQPYDDLSPGERASMALTASESYSTAVRGPFHFVEL